MERRSFTVFETDRHHRRSSYELKGTFSSIDKAIYAICENHTIPKSEFESAGYEIETKEDMTEIITNELWELRQTQGFEPNYIIEETTMDEWLD